MVVSIDRRALRCLGWWVSGEVGGGVTNYGKSRATIAIIQIIV